MHAVHIQTHIKKTKTGLGRWLSTRCSSRGPRTHMVAHDRVSLCSPSCPGIYTVDQGDNFKQQSVFKTRGIYHWWLLVKMVITVHLLRFSGLGWVSRANSWIQSSRMILTCLQNNLDTVGELLCGNIANGTWLGSPKTFKYLKKQKPRQLSWQIGSISRSQEQYH